MTETIDPSFLIDQQEPYGQMPETDPDQDNYLLRVEVDGLRNVESACEEMISRFYSLLYDPTDLPTFWDIGERVFQLVESSKEKDEQLAQLTQENQRLHQEVSNQASIIQEHRSCSKRISNVQEEASAAKVQHDRESDQLRSQIKALQAQIQSLRSENANLQSNISKRDPIITNVPESTKESSPFAQPTTQRLIHPTVLRPGKSHIVRTKTEFQVPQEDNNNDVDDNKEEEPAQEQAIRRPLIRAAVSGPIGDLGRLIKSNLDLSLAKNASRRVSDKGEVQLGPMCGLDADLKNKINSKLDPLVEDEVRQWVRVLVNQDLGDDLHGSLRSGVILCNIINTIQPNTIRNVKQSRMPFVMMENINNYLNACSTLGMSTVELFQTVDLFEAKNMTQVMLCLHSLGRMCSKFPGYSGPIISTNRP